MEMTITDSVKELQKWRDSFNYDWGDYCIGDSGTKHALDTAVETMSKYQKIQEIYNNWNVDFGVETHRAMSKIGEVLKDDRN